MELLFLLALFMTTSVGQGSSGIRVVPASLGLIPAGDTVLLTCEYDEKLLEDVQWFQTDGALITDEMQDFDLDRESSKYYLTMNNVGINQSGTYTCTGRQKNSSQTVSATSSITVYEKISFVNLAERQAVEQGKDIEVQCEASGQPNPSLSWKRGNNKIDDESERVYQDKRTKLLVIKNVTKDDEGYYTCIARQRETGQLEKSDIFVDVQYGPAGIQVQGKVTALEGDDVVLTCNSTGEPQPSFKWFRGKEKNINKSSPITDGVSDDGRVLTLAKATPADSGMYTCEASNTIGAKLNSTRVVILVPPVIAEVKNASANETSTAVISCKATGTPTPTVRIYRGTKLVENTKVLTPPSIVVDNQPGSATITFDPANYANNGNYRCVATSRSGRAEALVTLNVLYAPRDARVPVVYSCLKEPAELSCAFDANPSPDLKWGKMSQQAVTVPPVGTTLESVTTTASWQEILDAFGIDTRSFGPLAGSAFVPLNSTDNVKITSVDEKLLLKVREVGEDSFGEYYCLASNALGTRVARTQLVKAEVPQPPSSVKVTNFTTQSATVSFTAPVNVTVPIAAYVVDVVPVAGGEKKSGIVYPDDELLLTINELEHNTKYTFTVVAENCQGVGEPGMSLPFTTELITNPEAVDILESKPGDAFGEQTIVWKKNKAGGGRISRIEIKYWPEKSDKDGNENKTGSSERRNQTVKRTDMEFVDQEYTLKDLQPDTKYIIEMTVFNEVGNATARSSFITPSTQKATEVNSAAASEVPFEADAEDSAAALQACSSDDVENSSSSSSRTDATPLVWSSARREEAEDYEVQATEVAPTVRSSPTPEVTDAAVPGGRIAENIVGNLEPTEAPQTTPDPKLKMGMSNGLLVAVIVAAFFVILVIIDISCCICRNCGISFCIYSHTCGSAKRNSTALNGKDAEEGSAEYRKDSKMDEVAKVGSSDTQPLTEEAEPIANGTQAEQGVVNEETPLNGEKALNGEKPNAAKAPLMENEQPTPANSPMEASNVEGKAPVKPDDVAVAVTGNGQTGDAKETVA